MRLPLIVGRNKLRDSKIIRKYMDGLATQEELAEEFGISPTRVWQIIYRNRGIIKLDKEHERNTRVAHYKRLLNRHKNDIGKKDAVDILKELKTEVDGEKGSQTASETRVIIIREDAKSADQDQERSVPRPLSFLRV